MAAKHWDGFVIFTAIAWALWAPPTLAADIIATIAAGWIVFLLIEVRELFVALANALGEDPADE